MPAKLNYVELPATDIEAVKTFFSTVFGWQFEDFGPDYTAFSAASAGLDGGFYRAPLASTTATGAALIVFYSDELQVTLAQVQAAGGEVLKPIFDFPGGRRFHFADPAGNEWAVWGDPIS
ncbi:VOC family protein [Paraferrimonas sedimenticola]|uniref:Glyoxalase n=1 Tax=Paraferrimonas sedimenticola TaxID=375674 RepID=A0AA37RY44_9GAMM|nr:VOC family protein [Paraferrimonas sedimenticola]GLP97171.1 glyoxalase [Paraferrimonas sedimenticola]